MDPVDQVIGATETAAGFDVLVQIQRRHLVGSEVAGEPGYLHIAKAGIGEAGLPDLCAVATADVLIFLEVFRGNMVVVLLGDDLIAFAPLGISNPDTGAGGFIHANPDLAGQHVRKLEDHAFRIGVDRP